jgi:hypothetical protein
MADRHRSGKQLAVLHGSIEAAQVALVNRIPGFLRSRELQLIFRSGEIVHRRQSYGEDVVCVAIVRIQPQRFL